MSVFPCHQKITKVEGCDCECHDIEDTRVLQGAEEGSNQCQESLPRLDLPFQATCCYNELKGGALACCGDRPAPPSPPPVCRGRGLEPRT